MFSVTGEKMRCTGNGTLRFNLKAKKPVQKTVEFTVCADTHDEIIISYPDLKMAWSFAIQLAKQRRQRFSGIEI